LAVSQKNIKQTFLHYTLYNTNKDCSDLHIAYLIQSYIKIAREEQMEITNVSVHTMIE